ncbi:hypothetical protein CHUAL_001819 [Chamberlinius hualienensis]
MAASKKSPWKKRKTPFGHKWAPADGKWAWIVMIGTCAMSFCTVCSSTTFGVLLNKLMVRLDVDTATITWALAIRSFVASVLGPLITIMISRISCRKVAIIGGFLTSLSMILSAYAWRVEVLWITFGFVGGLAHSFIQLPLQVTLSRYFNKYYGIAIGFHSASFAVSRTIMTPLVQLIVEEYGVEWTFLLIGAIQLHIIVGAALFQPAEWHQVLIPMTEDELKQAIDNDKKTTSNPFEMSVTDTKIEAADVEDNKKSKSRRCCSSKAIDFSILKEPMFYFLIFHSVVQQTAIQYGTVFMFPFGVDIGLENMEAAALVSTRSISEIVGRLAGPVVVTTFFKKKLMSIFICDLISNGCLIGVLSYMGPDIGVFIVSAAFGLGFGSSMGLSQVVLVEVMGVNRLSSVMGIRSFILSFLVFGMGPIIGWVRDVTGSYRNCFRLLSGMELLLAVVWIAGLLVKRHRSL